MAKTPEMEKTLNDLAKEMFGRELSADWCVACGSTKVKDSDFRDALSRREFELSHFCQACQDSVWGTER